MIEFCKMFSNLSVSANKCGRAAKDESRMGSRRGRSEAMFVSLIMF